MNKLLTSGILAAFICSTFIPKVPACCSLFPARFSQTKGLAAEVLKDGKVVHLLGYQNAVNTNYDAGNSVSHPNHSGITTSTSPPPSLVNKFKKNPAKLSGNAMLLPIPAKPDSMTKLNIVDTASCPRFLEDMERAIRTTHPEAGANTGPVPKSFTPTVQIFEHDIYTIVLAKDATDIPQALKLVPESKRPALNREIFDAYAKWYKGWTFALCCFKSSDKAKAKPMLWWYEPQNPKQLFFPALDAHDGKAPDLKSQVEVDHAIILSSYKLQPKQGNKVSYSDGHIAKNISKLLPKYIIGQKFTGGTMPQGDFVADVKDVRLGKLNIRRELPPGAPKTN